MKLLLSKWIVLSCILLICLIKPVRSQFLMDVVDTTAEVGKGMLSIYRKFDRVEFQGICSLSFKGLGKRDRQLYGKKG
jgi:hypothetical protein